MNLSSTVKVILFFDITTLQTKSMKDTILPTEKVKMDSIF